MPIKIKWSKWVSLYKMYEAKSKTITPPAMTGVYKIKCFKNGKDIFIKRANEVEDEILYIGEAHKRTLKERIYDFWKASKESQDDIKTAHSAGNTYVLYGFQSKFPLNCLEVKWATSNNPKKVEKILLNKYKLRTLDIPPLNIKLERIWKHYS